MTPEELAIRAQDLKQMFESGDLSKEEFKELIDNIIIVETINNDALRLEENIATREIIVGIIDFASVLV
jgi:polyhydroxyalkanoate synthesis regulator phasin